MKNKIELIGIIEKIRYFNNHTFINLKVPKENSPFSIPVDVVAFNKKLELPENSEIEVIGSINTYFKPSNTAGNYTKITNVILKESHIINYPDDDDRDVDSFQPIKESNL